MNSFKIDLDSLYVAYYRASTEEQRDGLGLEAQKGACRDFVERYGGAIIKEVSEIISGGAEIRAGFNDALECCKKHNAILLVHKIDRLSRGGLVTLVQLEANGIPYIEAISPFDSEFSKTIKFLFAREEKQKIQTRVKDALAQIKIKIKKDGHYITKEGKKIKSLGSSQNLTDESRRLSIKRRKADALINDNNRRAYFVIKTLKKEHSLQQIADYLTNNGFKTSRGGDKWHAMQVSNLYKLFKE
jgi:DNA invertase Pin-like site-specific DNA recombinase